MNANVNDLMFIGAGLACGVILGSSIAIKTWEKVIFSEENMFNEVSNELSIIKDDLINTTNDLHKALSSIAYYESISSLFSKQEKDINAQYEILSEEWEKVETEKKAQKKYEDLVFELEKCNSEKCALSERVKNLASKSDRFKKQLDEKDSMIMNLEILVHKLQKQIDFPLAPKE